MHSNISRFRCKSTVIFSFIRLFLPRRFFELRALTMATIPRVGRDGVVSPTITVSFYYSLICLLYMF